MARCLFGAKPLSEPLITYCQSEPKEHISMKYYFKFKIFHSRKCTRKFRLWNDVHFVSASPCFNSLTPGKFEWNVRYLIFQIISVIDGWGISCELTLRWMSLDLTDDKSTLVQVMAWCRQATNHYLSQCWSRSLSPYGVTRPQQVNSLWPSDAIRRQRTESTLLQLMACCLTAQSHYLNQCWLIISKVLWHSSEGIIMRRSEDTNQ